MSANGSEAPRIDGAQRLLLREGCESVWRRMHGFASGGGGMQGGITGWWTGELRWARNRVSLASDRRDLVVVVYRNVDGREGGVATNQLDDQSLAAAVRAAEKAAPIFGMRPHIDITLPSPEFEYAKTAIWSDATYNLTAEARGEIARTVIDPAEAQGMLSAGYLEMRAQEIANFTADGSLQYATCTQAQCSMTVRDEKGSGSGWAGLSSYDWTAIDPKALAARALQKALASRDPVALEPGRYTVILEPQAVNDLVAFLLGELSRVTADSGGGPFTLGLDPALGKSRTKLGLKVADERVTISHDPTDPRLGVIPIDILHDRAPFRPVTWIDRGILTTLWDHRDYALKTRNDNLPHPQSFSYRMSGGETSVETMIQTTTRGLLVSRFSNIRMLDANTMLMTGLTRDGLWLVENGKITKAVKNFRFTDSPLFVLNSIDQLGEPVPVFRPHDQVGVTPAIVPPLKVHDFSFTSTIDAI